MNQNAECSFQ